MTLRPLPARWFEALVAHVDAAGALEALAATGAVEVELEPHAGSRATLLELQPLLDAYAALQRRYAAYWPAPDLSLTETDMPAERLQRALAALRAFAAAADPHIARLQALADERALLLAWKAIIAAFAGRRFDFGRLAERGLALERRVFLFESGPPLYPAAPCVAVPFVAAGRHGLIALGPHAALDAYQVQAAGHKGRVLPVPALPAGGPAQAAEALAARLAALAREQDEANGALVRLAGEHDVACRRGEIERLAWFARTAPALRASEQFATITGWTDDPARLEAALARPGLRALVHFPSAPPGSAAPLVLRNPPWAKPFELFSRALGVPGANEADPSRVLAFAVPLIFGYMFGDVGQGLVLVFAALALRRRFPIARLVMAGGAASVAFGFLFGSVFGQEHWIAAAWVHPLDHPVLMLAAPLAGGAVLLALGLALGALQARWAGELRRWLLADAGIVAAYLGLALAVAYGPALWLCAAALLWQLAGGWLLAHRVAGLRDALVRFVEELLRLAVNTVSFVRVGAFALAHTGLSAAVNAFAAGLPPLGAVTVLVLGNALVIVIEVIVVSVQTTRLVLFEFFIRFLRGSGRPFRPIAPPLTTREVSS